jgi:outer membrane immunogenic protein
MLRILGIVPLVGVLAMLSGSQARSAEPSPAYSWTGFYAGLKAGVDVGRFPESPTLTAPDCHGPACPALMKFLSTGQNVTGSGFVGGAEAGYNFQINNAVIGLEADFQSFSMRPSFAFGPTDVDPPNPASASGHGSIATNSLLTVRPRAGIAVDRSLFFLTGGFADINAHFSESITATGNVARNAIIGQYSASTSEKSGWIFGGGFERALFDHWIMKFEYLHADFGNLNTAAVGFNASAGGGLTNSVLNTRSHLTTDTVSVAMDYKL